MSAVCVVAIWWLYLNGQLKKQKETHSKRFIPYGMRCSNRYPAQVNQEPCTNTIIYQDTLEEAWRGLFEKVLDDQPLWTYLSLPENAVSNVAQIERELSTLESQIHSLIREQSLASDSIQGMYREQLGKLSERLSILKNSLKIETEKRANPR
ncbi:MAG TPA: hypothetical protein PLZ51_19045 [Aggregatilineales bacterium]|nr:hypothetical protein [Aggregatilineales bacterium]